jgi:AcrR family transcriptional regulator
MPGGNQRRKPLQERSQVTVDAILEATARILVEEGYARASTNHIAERAGISIGSLYHYFAGKDAIVDALAERVAERQIAAMVGALDLHGGMSLEPAVRGLVAAAIASQRVEAQLAHALLTQCPREGREQVDRRWKQRLTELLAGQMLAGQHPIRPARVELAAWVLVHAVFGVVRDAHAERPELVRGDALTDELTALALGYLRPG